MIQNTNILNYEKNLILKLLSETRTIRTKNINIFSFFKKNKIKNKNLINFYLKYKKIFYYPKKYKIRFIKIQKKKLFNYKYINKEIIPLYLKKKNKIFVQEKRNYSVIQLKTKKESEQIVQKINNGNKFEDCAKKKSIDFISAKKGGNLGWLPLRYIPEEIKKVNIEEKNKKIHIVKYKNNFLVFKLNGKKYQNIKKNNQKNYMIKNKILEKKLKNYVKKYKQKILKLLFLKSYNIHKLSKITKIPYLQTKWLSKNQIYKKFNFNNKKNKIFKINNNKNKFLFLNNNKKYYILEFYKTKNKKNKTFLESKKIIKNIIRYYQAEKKSKKYALKIINVLKSSSKKNKNYFNFSKKKIIHRYDNKPIKSLVFQQPIPKKNRIIYLITSNINNNIKIIILYKNDYKKFSEEKIKKIVKILLKNKKINILNILFDILYKKSLIEYQKNN
ncbi:peptidylprolyl isomerase [Buchnera aphidicola (Kurisakia onigurumii)]|uniref:peptidylprolyl isomerase n=1 Tax=Buchnera aphidicola TaxID=9 RepID=UPI0031B6DD87